jgi:bifunctional DNase/RNase
VLNRNGEQVEIDSRPSDAIALAVRVQAPIYAEEDVLNRGGVWLDKETGKPVDEAEPTVTQEGKQVIDEEMKKKASAFYDYINKIDLDDFGKRKS